MTTYRVTGFTAIDDYGSSTLEEVGREFARRRARREFGSRGRVADVKVGGVVTDRGSLMAFEVAAYVGRADGLREPEMETHCHWITFGVRVS